MVPKGLYRLVLGSYSFGFPCWALIVALTVVVGNIFCETLTRNACADFMAGFQPSLPRVRFCYSGDCCIGYSHDYRESL